LTARFRGGIRAGLAKWALGWHWFSGWLPRRPPPPRFGETASAANTGSLWGQILRRFLAFGTFCHHLPLSGGKTSSSAGPSPLRIPIGISLQFGRTRVIYGTAVITAQRRTQYERHSSRNRPHRGRRPGRGANPKAAVRGTQGPRGAVPGPVGQEGH